MSEVEATKPAENNTPVTGTEQGTETTGKTNEGNPGPKWDGDFDPERASRLVTNLREEAKTTKQALADANARLAEYEQAKLSDLEKLTLRAEAAEKELAEKTKALLVTDAARKHGLSDDLLQFITGTNPEEVETQAQLLAEKLATTTKTEAPSKPKMKPVAGNGADNASAAQLTREDLLSMSPVEVARARKDGRLNNILGIK